MTSLKHEGGREKRKWGRQEEKGALTRHICKSRQTGRHYWNKHIGKLEGGTHTAEREGKCNVQPLLLCMWVCTQQAHTYVRLPQLIIVPQNERERGGLPLSAQCKQHSLVCQVTWSPSSARCRFPTFYSREAGSSLNLSLLLFRFNVWNLICVLHCMRRDRWWCSNCHLFHLHTITAVRFLFDILLGSCGRKHARSRPKALLKIDGERYVRLNLWTPLLALCMTRLAAEGVFVLRPPCVLFVCAYVCKSAASSHGASLLGMFCF